MNANLAAKIPFVPIARGMGDAFMKRLVMTGLPHLMPVRLKMAKQVKMDWERATRTFTSIWRPGSICGTCLSAGGGKSGVTASVGGAVSGSLLAKLGSERR